MAERPSSISYMRSQLRNVSDTERSLRIARTAHQDQQKRLADLFEQYSDKSLPLKGIALSVRFKGYGEPARPRGGYPFPAQEYTIVSTRKVDAAFEAEHQPLSRITKLAVEYCVHLYPVDSTDIRALWVPLAPDVLHFATAAEIAADAEGR